MAEDPRAVFVELLESLRFSPVYGLRDQATGQWIQSVARDFERDRERWLARFDAAAKAAAERQGREAINAHAQETAGG